MPWPFFMCTLSSFVVIVMTAPLASIHHSLFSTTLHPFSICLHSSFPSLYPSTLSTPPPPGECSLHARSCNAGVGVFYLITKVQVLLVRGRMSSVHPSVYVDVNGEVPEAHGLLRPMFLSARRYARLEEMYLSHQVVREVTRHRAMADRVLRLDWY